MTPAAILAAAAVRAQEQVELVVTETAQQAGVTQEVAHGYIGRHLLKWLRSGLAAAQDARVIPWRVRIRLYRQGADEPSADTDDELPADRPGVTVLLGLPSVAAELAALADAYHAGEPLEGLDTATLRHRLKSIRPTLSRNRGRGAWRVPYKVGAVDWLARVDIQRETEQ